jgi:phage gp29-like protein
MGISTYEPPLGDVVGPSEAAIEAARRMMGGGLSSIPATRTRWYMSELEAAEYQANQGDLSTAAMLMSAARKDGVISGVLSTRTSGLVRLPKRFRGPASMVAQLELGHGQVRSVFDEMLPPQDLAVLAADGELLGVGVGELVPVQGRTYPVFVRLDPQFLRYRWNESRWYFQSNAGPIPITPGDGRWVLHTPGGRLSPWMHGLWRAVGRAYIRKEYAATYKDSWEAKLAHPARVAYAPNGSVEAQKDTFFKQVMAWGLNTVFGLSPGYEIKLLESNGRGYDSFVKTIAAQNEEIQICIAGQTVTTDGGAGFQNSDIHRAIRADLIKATADSLAYTVNTQVLPAWVAGEYGEDALDHCPVVEWDVTPPKDRTAEATALNIGAQAIVALTEALRAQGRELDIDAMCLKFGIPVRGDINGDGRPDLDADKPDEGDQPEQRAAVSLVREAA